MRKKAIPFLMAVLLCTAAIAQTPFQSYTFEEALQQAGRAGKYVLVLMDSKDCEQCNETATKGFEDKSLAPSLEKFINIRPKTTSEDWQQLSLRYEVPNGLAALFFSSNGVLLYKLNGSATMGRFYANAVVRAMENQSEIMNIESLTQSFSMDNSNIIVLQSLLQKRRDVLLSTDSLLDIYVTMLPADSLRSLTQLQYITRYAPLLGSKADSLVHRDYDRFNEAWYRMELQERIRINNSIIHKTRQRAITKKDLRLALRVAGFASAVNSNSYEKSRLYTYHMMYYYLGVKDTMNYLNYAAMYCDRFLMPIAVDSIQKRDAAARMKAFAAAKPDTVRGSKSMTMRRTVEFRPSTQFYTLELNSAAWNYYTMAKNQGQLAKAIAWAKRANEFYEMPDAMDTYARLLYKTGNQPEAIAWQEKAVALSKKRGFGTNELQQMLDNMKKGNSKIDNY